ncbi:dTDP-4-amino-4,6-dideoxygalactose transaminase [Aneurinibacillus soli]|nr:dTDP-4-amino-4,6-dideoxygalactose transaminase [Aneurinibacillus soli]
MNQALENRKFSGDGEFTKKCHAWFEVNLPCKKALLTTSCTHALEIAAILADIQEGDEVIMPSYTFVSTANAFVLRGAKIVFVDIRPDTMNINEQLIEQAITEKTKVIVPVHYAGVACEMDSIMEIARKYNLLVIEDAAQGVMSMYHDRALGTIGHIGCYSFHETKNYHCGEGGAIILNDERFIERAEIIREKGTDRSRLFRGQVDKYTWIDIGSSYLPSELNASFLYAQLEMATEINNNRLRSWNVYYENLMPLAERRLMEIPVIPERCRHNAHMFYIKLQNSKQRADMIEMLRENEIMSIFHYIPLHGTRAGINFSRFDGEDCYTTKESERLLRLPIYYEMNKDDIQKVTDVISLFFTEERKV